MNKWLKASALVSLGLVGGVVIAQQVKPDKKAIAAELQKMSAPAPEHHNLDPFVGTFDEVIEFEGGGGAPVMVQGDATGAWVLGNRFVQLNAHADNSEQVKFESIGYFGYNTQKKKYFAIGFDTGGTYAVYAEGDYDAANKTWTLLGETDEPAVGKVPIKYVIRAMPDKSITHEVFFKLPDGNDFTKVAKTTYKKK